MGMFDQPKAFASLSSGLLARKGAAKPAMRPQGFGQMGASLEDLGWNDMGFEAPKPTVSAQERDADHDAFGETFAEAPLRNPVAALTPSPVHSQQAELAEQFGIPDDADDEGEEEVAEAYEEEGAELPVAVLPVAEQPVTPLVLAPKRIRTEAVETPVAAVLSLASVSKAPAVRAVAGSGPKAAFTLRLDAARHLRLRLACALTGRSAQMLVTEAVDKLLADYPELETFAGQLPQGGRSRRAKG